MENQNIEWKEAWRDEYLKEICGFANAQGGVLKYGKAWDSVPVPYIKAEDFYRDAFDVFRKKAVSSGRLTEDDVKGSDAELLHSLKLTEGEYILRAASLLFYQEPEKWHLGSYVKIGYFENAADLVYQDEIRGPIITIPDRVMDTIYTKYFKGLIHYEGIQRVDRYPMPREALREAVLNAVVHRSYESGSPIQIKVFDDKIYVFNDARFPAGITEIDLQRAHKSTPYNPLIANAFFRSGQIEAWGRGIEKIKASCAADGLPAPEFRISAIDFMVCFHIRNNNKAIMERGINGGINGGINEIQQNILGLFINDPKITTRAIADTLGITRRSVEHHINQLKKSGLIVRDGSKKNGLWILKH